MKEALGRCFLLCLAGIWVFSSLGAQTTSTEILGLVRDTTGGVIPGADVTITRMATGEVRRGLTNDAGQFSFPLIEPGVYRVHVETPGFRPHTVTGVNVQFQQRARVNVTLEVGELTDVVEVVAGARLLHTDDAAVGMNIESERIVQLPTVYRNIAHLTIMTPGVVYGGRMGRTGWGGQTPPGTEVALVAHGQHEINQTITLDGVDAKDTRFNTFSLAPSLDAIAEFKVQTAAYSAEYGLGGGAHVQISMKSGTNEFHGSLYNFTRNDAMDAEHYFLNFELAPGEERRPKDRLRRHQFGAFLSGPVMFPGYDGRNRTFWSFNYEGRREINENLASAWYPSDAMRRGDFSEILMPLDDQGNLLRNPQGGLLRGPIIIYDPLTGEPFPNNIIPEERIHPGALNLLEFIPRQQFRQTDPLDVTNRGQIAPLIGQNAWFFRIDHQLTSRDKVFVRLAWDRQTWFRPQFNPHFSEDYESRPLNIATQWVHTFNPRVLNEFRFGRQRRYETRFHARGVDFDQDSLGLGSFRVVADGNRPLRGREGGIPPIGMFGIGDGATRDEIMASTQVANHLSILRGAHSFKMGFEYRRPFFRILAGNVPRGSLSFSALQSGHTFASLLLGYPNQTQTPEGLAPWDPTANVWGAYFQDSWQVHPKFTANLGLRYDYIGVPTSPSFRTLDFLRTYTTPDGRQIPTIFPDVPQGDPAANVKLTQQEKRFLMPRIGLAYRPSDNWVVRAGGGWYANITNYTNFGVLGSMPPRSGSQTFATVMDVAQTFPMEVDGQTFTIRTRSYRPGTDILELGDRLYGGQPRVSPENLIAIRPDRKNSTHWTWSLDVQRELPWHTALSVGYVGSRTTHIPDSDHNWNAVDPSPDADFQARRPFQQFHDPLRPETPVLDLGHVRYMINDSDAYYHGLLVSLDRRYSEGLAYGLSYTLSKAHGDSPGGGNSPADFQDSRDRRGSRGPQPFDRTHVAVINFLYEIPFARHFTGLAGGVLGGWQLNGIVSLRSGFPFTVGQPNNLNTGHSRNTIRPDRIEDGRLDNPTRELWFNPQAFQRVTCQIPDRLDLCRFGDAGKGIIRTPGERRVDLSLHKNFQVPGGPEGMRLQFRVEAFNAFNTPFFGNPTGIGFSTIDTIVPDSLRGGEIRSLASPMRIMQLGMKLTW